VKDQDFIGSTYSDLCAEVRALRASLTRERQRVAELEKALELARQASTKAWQLAVGGAT
jgi:hypothetical protein